MVKFLEVSISMNNKRMDESDVSASVASPADYIPYFSLTLDHLVSTSIDAELPLLLLICHYAHFGKLLIDERLSRTTLFR